VCQAQLKKVQDIAEIVKENWAGLSIGVISKSEKKRIKLIMGVIPRGIKRRVKNAAGL